MNSYGPSSGACLLQRYRRDIIVHMIDGREALAQREIRLAELCREGFRLAEHDEGYKSVVLTRLHPELTVTPDDLWTAIPWIWAGALGAPPPATGLFAPAVIDAISVLCEWFSSDEPLDVLRSHWHARTGNRLALGSTLRSHPFADLRSWFIRPQFAASSLTSRGS